MLESNRAMVLKGCKPAADVFRLQRIEEPYLVAHHLDSCLIRALAARSCPYRNASLQLGSSRSTSCRIPWLLSWLARA